MATATDTLSRVFSALADPTRRDILTRLESGPINVGDIAAAYDVSRPAISQHLKVLETAGLIERTVNAQWRQCSLLRGGAAEAGDWIAEHRAAWEGRFDQLDALLRKNRKAKGNSDD